MAEQEVGIAVLFSGDPETGETNMDVFREDDDWAGGRDPYHRAEGLRESVAPDFPDRLFAISLNRRARVLMTAVRLKDLLGVTREQAMEAAEAAVAQPTVTPIDLPVNLP